MNNIFDKLNPEQKEAVLHTEGPLLILAGAGSGKTRVLTHRIAYLIGECGVAPWNILAITFTNKAAAEMRERVDKIVGEGASAVWVSTFHSMCVRILRRHISAIGYDTSFVIYDSDDQKTAMRQVLKRLDIDTKVFKEKMFLGAISKAKDELISPEDYAANAGYDYGQQQIAKVYRAYEDELKKNNALDFDDLLLKTVQLFVRNPEILLDYQERFRYIMVDEYQDTNTVQFQLVRLLAHRYRNLCVVGDDDQSIYRFRGANIKNILNFEEEYADAHVIRLEQNYRSTEMILGAANGVIRNNKGRKRKTLWTANGEGEQVKVKQFGSAYEEAEYIVGDIRSNVRRGLRHYNDMAILYRTNAQSRLFEEKLVTANVPYKLVGGVNFYARKEIKDLLAYMKTIANGSDDISVQRIINVPKRGIGATSIARLQEYARFEEISLFDAICNVDYVPDMGRGAAKIKAFGDLMTGLRMRKENMTVAELLQEIIHETGYVEELELEKTEESQARIENINELVSKVVAYQETAENPSLNDFLEEVSLVADIDSLNEDSDYVVLMTLHSAKGLEFPVVYMTGLEEGLFPGYGAINSDDPTEIEEERRLCYVGITRAKEELTITCAKTRMINGMTQYNPISRFIEEIPSEYMDDQLEQPKTAAAPKNTAYREARKSFQTKPYGMSGDKKPYGSTSGGYGSYGRSGGYGSAGSSTGSFGSRSGGVSDTMFDKKPVSQKADGLSYGVGDRVSHIKFGPGTVQKINDAGRDYEVTVEFDRVGVKKMFAGFAKLKKL